MRNKVHNYICNRLTDFVVDPEHMLLYRRCSGWAATTSKRLASYSAAATVYVGFPKLNDRTQQPAYSA